MYVKPILFCLEARWHSTRVSWTPVTSGAGQRNINFAAETSCGGVWDSDRRLYLFDDFDELRDEDRIMYYFQTAWMACKSRHV